MTTKTRDDWKRDMSELYESVKQGDTDLKTSAELSNICGKWMKADALDFAWANFERTSPTRPMEIAHAAK